MTEPGASIYFMTARDFCDHIFLFEDGTFTHGSSFAWGSTGGQGEWSLAPGGDGSGAKLRLQLRWQPAPGDDSVPIEEALTSSQGGGTRHFAAESVALQHVGGDPLPSVRTQVPHARRALVFSSVGSQCLPVVRDHWLESPGTAEFDVALVFYKESSSPVYGELQSLQRASQAGVELMHRPGMKWPNFRHWVETQGGAEVVAAKYDFVWVVDDDVRLATAEINRMFRILQDHPEVKFACPSFDERSDGVWRFFDGHDARYKLRYTNFVECTAPVLRTSMLLDPLFQPCFRAVRTGCFIDFCFFPAAGGREDAVAVIDAVQCHHPPRSADAPSEMRQVQAWEDHKSDNVLFEREGVPKQWWCVEPRFFQPRVFGAIAAEATPGPAASAVGAGVIPGVLDLPTAGFGTAFYPEDHLLGDEEAVVTAAVEAAVRAGVRLFDCANRYSSQRFVGAALSRLVREGVVSRGELVIVAKLPQSDTAAEIAAGVRTALDELQVDYVDVLMPHIPPRPEAWQWLEAEVDAGRARHLGVSNYDQLDVGPNGWAGKGVSELRQLLQVARIRPAVHEFELHPLLQAADMIAFCDAEGIRILAYSPLGAPHKVDKYVEAVTKLAGPEKAAEVRPQLHVLQHPGVVAVASYRRLPPAQVVMAWHKERGFVPIPKSWDPEHVAENAPDALASISLQPQEMAVLDAMHADVRTVVLYQKGLREEL